MKTLTVPIVIVRQQTKGAEMPERRSSKATQESRDAGSAVQLSAEWGEALRESAIHFSDQIIGSYRGDYVLLSFGQVSQPQFLPGDTAAIAELQKTGVIPIRTQFRTAIPESEFTEFLKNMVRIARSRGLLSEDGGADATN